MRSNDGGLLKTVKVDNGTTTVNVVDQGEGVPEAVLDQIFEPFVTTKPPGHGTGLGMAVVYRIVEDHGGHIDIDSAPGAGTRVTLTFAPERGPAAPSPSLRETTLS